MANYNIDVKAKVNVQQLKSSIQESLNKTTIPVKPTFTPSVDDNNIKTFRNTVATYFSKEPIQIALAEPTDDNVSNILGKINKKFTITPTIKFDTSKENDFTKQLEAIKEAIKEVSESSKVKVSFDVDTEGYKQLFTVLENIKEEEQKISDVNIKFNLAENGQKDILLAFGSAAKLIQIINENNAELKFSVPNVDNLSDIKNYIDNYFKENPIILTISQEINDVELGSITEKVAELLQLQSDYEEQEYEKQQKTREKYNDQEIKSEIEKYKEIQVEYNKHQTEKRELRDKEQQESKKYMQEATLVVKEGLNEITESSKHSFDQQYSDLNEYVSNAKEELNKLSQLEVNQTELENAVELYRQEITKIVDTFREGSINIEEAENKIQEKISETAKEGIVPQEYLDNTKKELKTLEEEAEKSFDSWRKSQYKLYDDLQKKTEQQKKFDEQVWEDKAKSVQNMYDKEQISAEEYVNRMNSLLPEAYNKGYDSAEKYAEAVDKVEKEQDEAGQSSDNLGNKVDNLGSRFDNVFNSLMRYFGVTKIFDGIQNSFSKMLTEVKDLDAELTEFSKVSDLSASETQKFIDKAYDLGNTVARTGTEVVTATTLFKKMGYEIEESMKYAEDALMWTNVADGMVSVDGAATMLISTLKAYGEEAITTTQIIDSLNEVSNNYSTSSSALSDNLSTVAATLSASGVDLYQTIGLLTAGIEIMPDKASKVANGLKTISQRIRQIDGDTADKLDDFLGSKGISRYDELTGQLKSTYDILYEISDIWEDLSINERQYIGEVMAGKNQITVLNALMMNFSTAINATETAMNSAGSAAKENERVLDSIQGHINKFNSAFEELANNLISSDLFKNVVDFGTNLIKILNTLVEDSGRVTLLLAGAGITTALSQWQKLGNAFQQAQQQASALNQTLQATNRIDYFANTISGLQAVGTSIGIVVAAYTAMYQYAQHLDAEERKRFQNNIDSRNKEIQNLKQLINLEEEYTKTEDLEKKKHLEEQIYILRKNTVVLNYEDKQNRQEIQELLQQIKNDEDEIERLSQQKNLSSEEQIQNNQEIEALEQRISEANERITEIKQGGLTTDKLLKSEIGSQNDLYEDQLATLSLINIQLLKRRQYQENNEHSWGFLSHLPGMGNTPQGLEDYFDGGYSNFINDGSKSLQNKIDELKQLQLQIADDMLEHYGEEYYNVLASQYEFITSQITELEQDNEELSATALSLGKTVIGDLKSYTAEEVDAMGQLFDALSTGNIDDVAKAILELQDVFGEDLEDNFLDEIRENLSDPDIAQAIYDWITDFQNLKTEASDSASEITYSYSSAMGEMLSIVTETTTSIQEQYDTLSQAVDEFAESGIITKETLQSLTENDLLQYLEMVDGQLVLNEEAFYKDAEATLAKAAADIDAQVEADLLKLANEKLKESLDDLPSSTSNASTGITDVANAATDATIELLNDAGAAAETSKALANLGNAIGKTLNETNFDLQGYLTDAEKIINQANQLKSSLGKYTPSVSRGSSSSRSGSSGSSSTRSSTSTSTTDREAQQAQKAAEQAQKAAEQAEKEAQSRWKDGFNKLYQQLKTYLDAGQITVTEYYDALEQLNDKFFKDREEYEEEYWKYQDEIVKGRKKYLEDQIKDLFQKGETLLEHQLTQEQITQEEYFDKLEALYKQYYTDKDEYAEAMWKLQQQRYQYELDEINKQIQAYQDSLSNLFGKGETVLKYRLDTDDITEEEYLDLLEELYRASIDNEEELNEKLLSLDLQRYKLAKEQHEQYIKDLESQLQDLYDEAQELHEEYVNSLEQQSSDLETTISFAIDVLDEEIAKLKDEKEALDEANDALQEQMKLQELQDALEKAKQKKVRVYRKGQGFVYEQDTQAVGEAQTAIDEYKRELSHKKQMSIIDEEIQKLEEYKKEWQNITKNYQKAQDQMTAEGVLGENARERVLNKEKQAVIDVGNQYNNTKDRIKQANDATLENMEAFIGDKDKANSLAGKIDKLNKEIEKVKSVEVGAEYKLGENGKTQFENIVDGITDLQTKIEDLNKKKIEIEAKWKAYNDNQSQYDIILANITNLRNQLSTDFTVGDIDISDWYNTIEDMIDELEELKSLQEETGTAPDSGGGDSGGGDSGGGDSGGGDSGNDFNVGDWVYLPDSDVPYTPFQGKKFKIVEFQDGGSIAAVLVEGGNEGEITYKVPVNHLQHAALGTLGTASNLFVVNENGLEAMVTPEGTVVSAPTPGYGVIKNEYTERLTDFAADPLGFLNKTFKGYSSNIQNNSSSDQIININGNLNLPNVTNGENFVDSLRTLALQYTTRRR